MTAVIIRHELIRTRRSLLMILGIAIVAIILTDLLALFSGMIGLIFASMLAFLLLPAVQLYLAIDFYRSSYGSGAILTHSLPVSGRRLFWSKILYAFLTVVVTGLVPSALLVVQLQLGLSMAEVSWTEASAQVQLFIHHVPGALPGLIYGVSALIIMPVATFFPSVVIGNGGWARRLSVGGPIIVFMSYYLVMQVFGVVSFFIPGVYDFVSGQFRLISLWHIIQVNDPNPALPVSIFIAHVIAIAVLLVWASRDMQSKVELR